MTKMASKNTLIIILLAVTIIVVFMYILSLRKQVSALEEQKLNLAQALATEKELGHKLSEQNSALKENLRVSQKKISKLFSANALTQRYLEDLSSRFSMLQAENKALREEKEKILMENDSLMEKLGIRKVIGDLKKQVQKVGREIKQRAQEEKLNEGNRGYIIKDGKATRPAKVKIEVIPALMQ